MAVSAVAGSLPMFVRAILTRAEVLVLMLGTGLTGAFAEGQSEAPYSDYGRGWW